MSFRKVYLSLHQTTVRGLVRTTLDWYIFVSIKISAENRGKKFMTVDITMVSRML